MPPPLAREFLTDIALWWLMDLTCFGITTPGLETHLSSSRGLESLVQASWNLPLPQTLIKSALSWSPNNNNISTQGLAEVWGWMAHISCVDISLLSNHVFIPSCLPMVCSLHHVCIRWSWIRRRGWRWESGFCQESWPVRRPTSATWRRYW